MSTSLVDVRGTYIGYNELVLYLRDYRYQKKSFWGFLLRYREVVVISSMSSLETSWEVFNNIWISRFIQKARDLNVTLDRKVETERLRYVGNLKNFWRSIIKECEKRRELSVYEAKKNRILFDLSEVDNDIKTTRTEIAEISNEWQSEESPDLSFEIDADVFELDLSLSHAGSSGSRRSQQPRITIEDPEDEVRSSGNVVGEDFNREIGNERSTSTAVDGDFNGEIGGEPNEEEPNEEEPNEEESNEEGNNSISPDTTVGGLGSKNAQQKNKRKRPTPSLTRIREVNPRNKRRVNYNVGSPSRKRRKKPFPQPPPPPPSPPSPQSPLSQISLPPLSPVPSLPICLKCPQHCF